MRNRRFFLVVALIAALVGFEVWLAIPPKVHAQTVSLSQGIHTSQVTLGAAATQATTTSTPCREIYVQDNAGHNVRVGDSAVSATRGALLLSASNGSITIGSAAGSGAYALDLNQIFLFGTAADVIDVICIQ